MRLKHSATSDPRWHELVETYQTNWVKAFRELFGKTPTPQQILILNAAEGEGKFTTVSAGDGVGAHTAVAAIAIMRVILYPQGRVVLAPACIARKTLKYMDMQWCYLLTQHPWLDMYFKLTGTRLRERTNDSWAMVVKGIRTNKEEALAGESGEHHLTIVLGASNVPDKAFGIITGGIVNADNGLLLLSQPVRRKGYFYQTHNELSRPPGVYTALTLNAEDSPLVSSEFIEMKKKQYGGPDSNEYRQKVQGRFPLPRKEAGKQ